MRNEPLGMLHVKNPHNWPIDFPDIPCISSLMAASPCITPVDMCRSLQTTCKHTQASNMTLWVWEKAHKLKYFRAPP